MENVGDKFSIKTIKIEVQELEQNIDDWIQIDYGPKSGAVDSAAGVRECSVQEIDPLETDPVTTVPSASLNDTPPHFRCPVTSCAWYSENVTFLLLKDHISLSHQEITDICSACFSVFNRENEFLLHAQNVHSTFQCQFCGLQFESKFELDSHSHSVTKCSVKNCSWSTEEQNKDVVFLLLKSHAKVIHKMEFVCEVCYKIYQNRRAYTTHFSKKHLSIKCLICNMYLTSNVELKEHVNQVHYQKIVEDSKITCRICNCHFFHHHQLRCHLQNFHWVSTEVNMEHVNFTMPLLVKKMKCNLCTNQYLHSQELIDHYYNVHHEKIHSDLGVNSMPDLSNWYTLSVSYISNEEGALIFSCNLCSEIYSTCTDLNLHTSDIHQKYVCSKCCFMLNTTEELELHLEVVHTGYCKICNFKSFNSNELLSHFMQMHENVDISGQSLLYKVTNSDGVVYHTCKFCRKALDSVISMKLHYYYYHNVYVCNFCYVTFDNVENEISHFKMCPNYNTENMNVCEMCGKCSKSRSELVKHREKHGENLNGFSSDLQLKLKSDIELHMDKFSTGESLNDEVPQKNDGQLLQNNDSLCNPQNSQKNGCMNTSQNSQKNSCLNTSQNSQKNSCLSTSQISQKNSCLNTSQNSQKNDCLNTSQNSQKNSCLNTSQNSQKNDCLNTSQNSQKNSCLSTSQNSQKNSCLNTSQNSQKNSCLNTSQNSQKNSCLNTSQISQKNGRMKVSSKKGDNLHYSSVKTDALKNPQNEKRLQLRLEDIFIGSLCKICNRFYTNISSHLIKRHQISNKCPICRQEFSNSWVLHLHLKRHPKFKCNECDMKFHSMKYLVMHVNELHTKYYAFYCSKCDTTCSTATEFNLHVKLQGCQVEANMLPALRCELCDHLCFDVRIMRKHMKSVHFLFGHILNIKRKSNQLPASMYTVFKKTRN